MTQSEHKALESNKQGLFSRFLIRPFKLDIVFLFCLIIIPTVMAVTTFTYYKNSAAVLEMTNKLVEKITNAVIEKTTNYLKPAHVLATITSQLLNDPTVNIGPGSELENYFISILRAQSQIDFVYYGNEDGDFIDALWVKEDEPIIMKFIYKESGRPMMTVQHFNEKNEVIKEKKTEEILLDPRLRPWYKQAKALMSTCWTDLYVFASTGKPGITAACPVITESGSFLGVIAADITLFELSNFLGETKISKNSIVFIMDKRKQFVAYPDPDRIVKVKDGKIVPVQVSELNERRITDAVRRYEDTGDAKFTFETGGKRNLAFFTPFPASFGKEWTIAVLAPEDDFLGPIKKTHRETLIISCFILLIAIGFGLLFARNLSKPIEKLTAEVRKIKGFELSGKVDVHTYINEIQTMSNAIQSMKTGLQAFSRYVPSELVRQLIESGEEAKPGGRGRELTLFFSDITNFTGISEQIPARELLINLSEYLDVMSRVITDEKGTVDKYIGDGVMAFWGAPISNDEHAACACRAALRCQRVVDELNKRWETENKLPFRTRMGLHTGFTIVGNMGSNERLNYTVLGNNVNLASRLEGINKLYGTNIIISQATHRYVRNDFILRPLDIISVMGRTGGVKIYELMGDEGSENMDQLKALAGQFESAFEFYLNRQWHEALDILESIKENNPNDKPISILQERCKSYLDEDPEPSWSGIVRLDAK